MAFDYISQRASVAIIDTGDSLLWPDLDFDLGDRKTMNDVYGLEYDTNISYVVAEQTISSVTNS